MPPSAAADAAGFRARDHLHRWLGAARLAITAWAGAVRAGRPADIGLDERLGMIATRQAPLQRPVQILWNERQVPFIQAATDADLPVAIGIVHAHLRLWQIEMMRRIAAGRLSEVFGAATVRLDQTLRTVDFLRAGRCAAKALSPQAAAWMRGFLSGLNHQIAGTRRLPHEFDVLGMAPEPWSFDELMAVSRLASTDFTWKVWIQLLELRGRPDWKTVWSRLVDHDLLPDPSFAGSRGALIEAMNAYGRGGSNAYAVSGARTSSGHAMLASDPHLAIQVPNLWLIAGLRSPGCHAIGLMIPAVPVLGLGRNRHIAWGGTNLHAASSELVQLGDRPGMTSVRSERINVRWSSAAEAVISESDFGPVISDAPLVRRNGGDKLALHWMGHRPTDEVTPFLAMMRSRNWREFLDAIDGHAIPGLNMVYADAKGHIGQAMAARLPRRPHSRPDDIVSKAEALDHWERMMTARDLPHEVDPPRGFVASANNAPPPLDFSISLFFSPDDRIERLREVLGSATGLALADLARLQLDVASRPALRLRDRLLPLLPEARAGAFAEALRKWDGGYGERSAGALAFELLLYHLIRRLHGRDAHVLFLASWEPWTLIERDLDRLPKDRLRRAARSAAASAAPAFRRLRVWGNAHRLRLAHPLVRLPLVGRRYIYEDRPVGGSNETLMKTRHGFSKGRHNTTFGAQARFLADLADLDESHFVLLGGQDGWVGSSTFIDQATDWREGRHIRLPLRPETVRKEFRHVTELHPRKPAG